MLPLDALPGVEIAITLALLVAVFIGFVRERPPVDVVALVAMAVLLGVGILGPDEIFGVFSNSAPIAVACMFVLSAALERTGVIDRLGGIVGRMKGNPALQTLTLLLVVIVISAFVNNTPVVVILIPVVIALAQSQGVASSKLLIPLSYASIFGGTLTLIGTSSNLLVDGVAQDAGLAPFTMFEIMPLGLVMGGVGVTYLMICGKWLLPERTSLQEILPNRAGRRFLTEVLVPHDSPLVGRTLKWAGLSPRNNFEIVDVIRHDVSLRRELDTLDLEAGDRIVIRSNVADVISLRNVDGLTFDPERAHAIEPIGSQPTVVMEGLVGPNSRFAGMRVGDLRLRKLFGVYVLAVHRQDEGMRKDFEQVRLNLGDTLLLEGPPDGVRRLFDRQDLVNLTEPTERAFRRNKAPIALGAIAVMMVLAQLGVMPIAPLAMMAAVAVVALGCLDSKEAYEAIHWRILMLIFGMLALGTAMQETGTATLLVGFIASTVSDLGPVAVLSAVYFITSALTEIISNNAAAILLTPVAIGLAYELGADPRPFVVAVMFAASASFATPIGYQTNTLVYSAGGYRFGDFLKIGLPLNILLWIVATFAIPVFWPLH